MSVTLNGSTGYLEWSKGAGTMPATAFPFSMVVRVKSPLTSANMFAVAQGQSNADRYSAGWYSFGGFLANHRNPGNGSSATQSSAIVSSMVLAIVTFDSPTRRTVAVGTSTFTVDNITLSDDVSNHDRITIGAYHVNGNAPSLFWQGDIAEVHFFNRALGSADYTTLNADYKPEQLTGWVDGWSLKDATDLTSIGGTRTLTLNGGVTSTGSHPITRAAAGGPALSAGTIANVTATTATVGVTTDTSTGTLYVVNGAVNTAPTAAQIKAGQNNSGATVPSANQAITTSGAKTAAITGLTSSTTYYPFWVHTNGSGVDSTVFAGTSYTTSAAAATAVTLTGPTTATVGSASTNFTVGANGAITGTVVVTPSDGGAGGTFNPTSVSISSGTPTATFTYTPSSAGTKTISVTNNGGLTAPSSISLTASTSSNASVLATTKFAGPNGGTTPTFDSTGANCIAVFLSYGGTPTVSDNKGNTYVAATTNSGASPSGRWYYSKESNLVSVGTGHTVTIGGGNTASSCIVYAISNTAAGAPIDPGATSFSNATSVNFGVAITPPENNCLILQAAALITATISGVVGSNGWTVPQWTSGVGGNNYGSISAYKAQTTVATIASNGSYATWTGTTSGNQAVLIFKSAAAGGGGGITIASPKTLEVHQRSGTTGSIQISGTVTGATEDIEASFNGGAFQTIASAVAAGSFSGVLTGQTQGQGILTVRKKTTTTVSATVADVGIGDVFLVIGDSRAEGRGTNQSFSHASLKASAFRQDGNWALGNDAVDSTPGAAGTPWPLLATRIMASQNVPVAFITCGTGGTDVAGVNNTWAKPNADYSGAITAVTNSTVSGVRAVLALLGPNAVVNSNNAAVALATYRTALDTLATNLAADVPGAPKIFVDVCGEVGTGSPPDRRTALNNIRGAVLSAWNNNSTAIKPGPVLIDQDYADNVHPTTSTQLQQVADRLWLSLSESLYGGSAGRGPRIQSASFDATKTQLTVVFDRALKTGQTFSTAPWIVNDNGTARTISSVAYHSTNPNALVVTISVAATGAAGTVKVSFASGDDAVGQSIPQSVDISLPAGGTTNLPAEPFYDYTITSTGVLNLTDVNQHVLRKLNGYEYASEPFTVRIYNDTTGALVVEKSGTTTARGLPGAISDPSLSPGTIYDLRFKITSNGAKGWYTATAT